MATGIPEEELHKAIGHDGSHIQWPDYNDIRRYRGFCSQEIVEVLLCHYDIASVTLYPRIALVPKQGDPLCIVNTKYGEIIEETCGILLGDPLNGVRHTLASIRGTWHDPDTGQQRQGAFIPDEYILFHGV